MKKRGSSRALGALMAVWLALTVSEALAAQVDQLPATRRDALLVATTPPDDDAAVVAPRTKRSRNAGATTPASSGAASSRAGASPNVAPATTGEQLDLGSGVMKSAVTAADEDYAPSQRGGTFGAERTSRIAKTDRAFEAAEIGTCGGPDTLKFDPVPVWGDFVIGVLALPYALRAMATGHCHF